MTRASMRSLRSFLKDAMLGTIDLTTIKTFADLKRLLGLPHHTAVQDIGQELFQAEYGSFIFYFVDSEFVTLEIPYRAAISRRDQRIAQKIGVLWLRDIEHMGIDHFKAMLKRESINAVRLLINMPPLDDQERDQLNQLIELPFSGMLIEFADGFVEQINFYFERPGHFLARSI